MESFGGKCVWDSSILEVSVILIHNLLSDFEDWLNDALASLFSLNDFELDFSENGSLEMLDIKRDTFNAHNNYRTMHGCPPLMMSEELSSIAQGWAEKLAEKGFLQYSENPGLGENITLVDLDQSTKKGEQIVKEWYKEINNYNYNKPGWKRGAYHVSQLLWKSTTEIGVGVAKVPGQNKAYVVVNYRPAGNNNMPGEFERNVLPPQKKVVPDNNVNMRKNINRR
ncbi:Golgi-associated plant pathogenesis-related protein 1-like isoform X1 [Argiope bruennichi]|uniref:Golgi-associated plant pathogenesis-related like protein n=1 Tax=Argiope bruennichi TaxID=94029 RepID=A0A8T0FHA9_ARGBR|nr:Golgi-associated plant pathogenesis-related protein 1-like isoform X1 [Argiope bruennichi]KAF8788859.1 Golgi-associated plant pathogenesis-related like protein [Argiope bruennichi]